jgi:pimeloyl-ACP methyl ester carboxylesterase
MRLRRFVALTEVLSLTAVLSGAAPVSAGASAGRWRHDYSVVRGFDVPATPDGLDKIAFERHWFGGTKAPAPDTVLVLIPGFIGGAHNFVHVGQRLVERDHSLQVWGIDRRNNLLENRCAMEGAADSGSVGQVETAAAYYLGLLPFFGSCPRESDDPDPMAWNGASAEYSLSQDEAASVGMRHWGLETALRDIRKVVKLAHKRYPNAKVVLGGHSLGGMTTQMYAGWRFGKGKRTAGWKTIDGMVLIDGAVNGLGWDELIGQYVRDEELLDAGTLFWNDMNVGADPLLGFLAELGGMAASFAPQTESFLWSSLEGTPLAWPDPETCPTNKAVFAGLTDEEYGFNATFQMHQGDIDPRVDFDSDSADDMCDGEFSDRFLAHWTDFDQSDPVELTDPDDWAEATWSSEESNFVEWYFSIAYNSELDLAGNLNSKEEFTDPRDDSTTTAVDEKRQRIFDTEHVALPVYAIATAECRERFDWYATRATGLKSYKIVDRSAEHCPHPAAEPYAHLDPIMGKDTDGFTNDFIATVSRWLKKKF